MQNGFRVVVRTLVVLEPILQAKATSLGKTTTLLTLARCTALAARLEAGLPVGGGPVPEASRAETPRANVSENPSLGQ